MPPPNSLGNLNMFPVGGTVRGGMIVQPSRGSLLLCVDFESSLLILLPDWGSQGLKM